MSSSTLTAPCLSIPQKIKKGCNYWTIMLHFLTRRKQIGTVPPFKVFVSKFSPPNTANFFSRAVAAVFLQTLNVDWVTLFILKSKVLSCQRP
jgi:hypothetical protein